MWDRAKTAQINHSGNRKHLRRRLARKPQENDHYRRRPPKEQSGPGLFALVPSYSASLPTPASQHQGCQHPPLRGDLLLCPAPGRVGDISTAVSVTFNVPEFLGMSSPDLLRDCYLCLSSKDLTKPLPAGMDG